MTSWWWRIASTICRCLSTLWQWARKWRFKLSVGRVPLPQVSEYPHFGVTLTSSLIWVPHIRKLQTSALVFASNLFHTFVLPSALWGAVPAVRLLHRATRRWSRCLLGWPRGSPVPAVHLESGWPDAKRLITRLVVEIVLRFQPLCVAPVSLPRNVFTDSRMQWCRRCSVRPDSATLWIQHPWLFNLGSDMNTLALVRAHVAFVGQVCERFTSL